MRPLPLLLVVLLALPLIEIYLLIKVGGWAGPLATVFLVVFTAVFGVLLLRQQGFTTVRRVRAAVDRGQVPAMELLEGMLLVVGGGLLLLPGFLTDAVGFLCLIPPARRWLVRAILDRHLLNRRGPPGGGGPASPSGPVTLEGEYRREDD